MYANLYTEVVQIGNLSSLGPVNPPINLKRNVGKGEQVKEKK